MINLKNIKEKYDNFNKTWWGETISTIVFVVVMVIIIRFFIGEIRWIPSGSMHPTLIEGDRIVVERFSRFLSTKLSRKPVPLISRLTGILCKDVAYIKRVIGLPGDKIEIKFEDNGAAYVYINDKKYKEDYIKSEYEYPLCAPKNIQKELMSDDRIMKCGPFKLAKNEFFMMGDNRGNSQDSRYWGVLKKDRFIGRAVFLFWPIDRIKVLSRLKNTI